MPAAPSEPEKYSIEEMMDRLQSKPEIDPLADGELITRPDGTQVVKVRRRKRRSSQPQKEEAARSRKAKMVQLSAVLILLILVALVVGGAVIYTNSPLFREKVLANIADSSGAKVDLVQFRMNPLSANARHLTLAWPEGNPLEEFKLNSLRATIHPASIISSSLTGEEVTALQGDLKLRIPVAGQPGRVKERTEGLLPANFKRLGVGKLDVSLGDRRNSIFRIAECEGSFYPKNVNERPELRLNRGNFLIKGWPMLRMDRAYIEFRGQETDIISLRLLHEKDDSGILMLSGTVLPFSAENESELVARLESFQIAGIVGPSMGRFLSGRIDSPPGEKAGSIVFSVADPQSGVFTIPFQTSLNSYLQFSGFSFFGALAQSLEDKWFETPLFEQDSSGILERRAGAVHIRELSAESRGRLAIRGDIRIDKEKRLSGELRVGVASAMIGSAPTRRLDLMFSENQGGFRWIRLTLGGTVNAPTDNFRALFDKAEVPPATESGASQPPSFEELTKPR